MKLDTEDTIDLKYDAYNTMMSFMEKNSIISYTATCQNKIISFEPTFHMLMNDQLLYVKYSILLFKQKSNLWHCFVHHCYYFKILTS